MKPKIYPILEECIESGILFGFRRAFKHDDNPSEEQVVAHMLNEIMFAINEKFDFEDLKND
jgi:hypothetical protein